MLQFVTGGIERSDFQGNAVNLLGSLSREAKEEIGIDLTDSKLVSRVMPKYMVQWGSIALVYLIELAIESHELKLHYGLFESTLLHKGITPEFASLILVHTSQMSDFLKNDLRSKLDFLPVVLEEICKEGHR
ncbi:hypothetical protein [Paenibacillus humicola]|uniref:hypothetical protein n=1 Tax=Paenibacillus humicola TaxID=3110540 RepID=UPI00237B0434|nr:hypothetical protein [Paenibacillus humicola]